MTLYQLAKLEYYIRLVNKTFHQWNDCFYLQQLYANSIK